MSNQRLGILEELITIAIREGHDPSPELRAFLEDVARVWGIDKSIPDLFWLSLNITEDNRDSWTFHFMR